MKRKDIYECGRLRMLSPEFCLYCYQNPPWLKERKQLKAQIEELTKQIKALNALESPPKRCPSCRRNIFRKGYGAVQTSRRVICIFCACRQLKAASREASLITLTAQKGEYEDTK